jgi:anthranilate synthase component 1
MRDTRMSLASFERLAARGNLVPVWRELPGDTETPVSAFLKLPSPSHAFLLESVQGGERWGRYSFLGDEPIALIRQGPEGTLLEQSGSRTFEDQLPPLDCLRELMDAFEFVRPDDAPPFVGGLVGYLGHGAVRWFEPRVPQRHGPDPDFPDGEWMLVDRCAVFDNLSHRLRIWASVHLPLYATVEEAYRAAMRRADALAESFQRPLPPPAPAPELGGLDDGWDRAGFEAAVTRAREYIAAGDCYQVVLSRRLSADYRGDPFDLYRSLRRVSPTPYLFFLRFGDRALAGASPELLVRLSGETVTVRPIAGTRKRGATPAEDAALEAELQADPKERAEHVMLVDLGRNDVGRVSRPGTVKVEEREVIERYSHVMHMVSGVEGELAAGRDAFDLFAAAFPAGTLVGAPKVRAMEIIDELEPVSRGLYGGTVGYFGARGDMDHAITIRTLVFAGDEYSYQAGAGIVADSVPATEHEEVLAKSAAMVRALELAGEGL